MTKGQLIRTLPNWEKIDVAIPLDWSIAMRQEGIETSWYAWDYREDTVIGKPLNLLQIYCDELNKTVEGLMESNMEFFDKVQLLEKNIRKQEEKV